MISRFETLLGMTLAPALGGSVDRIGFLPPDESWRNAIGDQSHLNVYLVELTENRKLRSSTGSAPFRIDCHYLISAWEKKSDSIPPHATPSGTSKEADLLYEAAALILARAPIVPAEFPTAAAWGTYETHRIPITLIPPDGFPKLPEFWGTMGSTANLWKPVLHLIATLPLDLPQPAPGPPVVKIVLDVYGGAEPGDEPSESRITVSGTVLAPDGTPLGGRLVTLICDGTRFGSTHSAADGRFTFLGVPPGPCRLEAVDGLLHGSVDLDPSLDPPTLLVPATYDVRIS